MSGNDCNAVKTAREFALEGGAVDLALGGAGSKGVKSDGGALFDGGSLNLSLAGDTALIVETNASSVVYVDPSYCCGVKASNIVVNAGVFTMLVNGRAGRGLSADDGLNASSNITINGGTILCSASNNDGIDSNGTFLFNGGIIASFGTTSPEEGLDCDQNTFTINGGTFVGCGGATSYPNAGTQYALAYTGTVSSNTVVRIANASGSIFAFKMPRTYSSSVVLLCSCPSIASSGTYTVYTGATMTTGTPFHGLYTNSVSSASGGTSKGSDSTPTSHYYSVP